MWCGYKVMWPVSTNHTRKLGMLLYIHTECSEFSMNTEDRKSRNNPQTCFEANFYLHLQQTFCKGPVKRGQIDLFPPPCFFLSLLLGLFILLPTNANTKESHKIKRKVKRKGGLWRDDQWKTVDLWSKRNTCQTTGQDDCSESRSHCVDFLPCSWHRGFPPQWGVLSFSSNGMTLNACYRCRIWGHHNIP